MQHLQRAGPLDGRLLRRGTRVATRGRTCSGCDRALKQLLQPLLCVSVLQTIRVRAKALLFALPCHNVIAIKASRPVRCAQSWYAAAERRVAARAAA